MYWGLGLEYETNLYQGEMKVDGATLLRTFCQPFPWGEGAEGPPRGRRVLSKMLQLFSKEKSYEAIVRFAAIPLYLTLKYHVLPQIAPEEFAAYYRANPYIHKHDEI